ncbi:MAG: hypothetical protein FJ264_13155 [Planctomycetes bacterium]|nr:hypothetical protein [Planctomycetota bacterium]
MELNHVGIVNRNENQALKFYRDFLGIEKTREILLAPELSNQLFSVSQEIKILVFEKPGIKLEVFLLDFQHATPNIIHFGMMIDSYQELAEKAKRFNVEIIIGKHKEKTVYFLKDFSGNLIEIKQKS